MTEQAITSAHRPYEDVAAILTGALLVALGVTFFNNAILLTGGTAGLALLLGRTTGFEFGIVFFSINLPFYYLAIKRMGWWFAVKTFLAVILVSMFSKLATSSLSISHLNPLFAAISGGALTGIGMLILFRHRASLGGINIFALYLQERLKVQAGYVQLAVDVLILLGSLFVLEVNQLALSFLGTLVLNLVLATNHRPGRYTGVSREGAG
ncbi:YitT family protein [Microvirga sp. CF3016]|uniref:YitT family protein n=1 Tax=Microvirga sp. CF3016 TaxID=3110181 RepID=UPI002E76B6D7|nr:YitT family protein [Microvirga sp. CF3016]MEE1609829.1 YitT family protein [Microvirga sp. CF3016]